MAAHAPEMFRVLSDPAIYAYENDPPASVDWLRERYARLESRRSPDGREQWLNWVIRVPGHGPVGFVQATVHEDGEALIAYVLGSAYWGRGWGLRAVAAMIAELEERYPVRRIGAVSKDANRRSVRLLEKLGFSLASADEHRERRIPPDEILMVNGPTRR